MDEEPADLEPSLAGPLAETSPELLAVLESASRLQQMVPDAVLVGDRRLPCTRGTGTPTTMITFSRTCGSGSTSCSKRSSPKASG